MILLEFINTSGLKLDQKQVSRIGVKVAEKYYHKYGAGCKKIKRTINGYTFNVNDYEIEFLHECEELIIKFLSEMSTSK